MNNWRKFFHVNTLADICEPENISKVQSCFLKQPMGKPWRKKNTSLLHWPIQHEPGQKGFKLWYAAIKNIFQLDNKYNIIQHKLGYWNDSHLLYNTWVSYCDNLTSQAITSSSNGLSFRNLVSVSTTTATCEAELHDLHGTLTPNCIPADLLRIANIDTIRFSRKVHMHSAFVSRADNNTSIYTNYKVYHKTLPKWKQILVKHPSIIKTHSNHNDVVQAFTENNKVIMSTDRGTYHNTGAFGISISNGSSIVAYNKGRLIPNDFYQSSFRSEMYGILAGPTSMQILYEFYHIDPSHIKTIEINCDNQKVIQRIQARRKLKCTTNQHCLVEIVTKVQILDIINDLQIHSHLGFKYVPGHQERTTTPGELSLAAKLNIQAHRLCIEARATANVLYFPFPTAVANFCIDIPSPYMQMRTKSQNGAITGSTHVIS
jgi:hypothetical protein